MKKQFLEMYGTEAPHKAIAFSLNEKFSQVIKERMDYYNSSDVNSTIDSLGAVRNQIDEVKDVMVQNIEKVLERGEKIELLVDKTDRLNQQAFRFEVSSRNLRRHLYWRKVRSIIASTAVVSLFIYILVVWGCGGFGLSKCKGHH